MENKLKGGSTVKEGEGTADPPRFSRSRRKYSVRAQEGRWRTAGVDSVTHSTDGETRTQKRNDGCPGPIPQELERIDSIFFKNTHTYYLYMQV